MNKEIMDKCLDFAEGAKGMFTIRSAKNPGFPGTLLDGSGRQRMIIRYSEQGYSTLKIAEILGVSHPTVIEHMQNYRRNIEFHDEWCAFWEFIAPVRQLPVSEAFVGLLTEFEVSVYAKRGVKTIEDLLRCAVTMPTAKFSRKLNNPPTGAAWRGLDASRKHELFDRLRELCYQLLATEKPPHGEEI